ncbi:MAG: SPFH domain-containing protein [Candidatus Thorarchaeota archaeon]
MQIIIDSFLYIALVLTFAIFTLMFVCSGIKVVREWERIAVLRLGKYYGIRGPGIVWIVPILDKIALKVSLREQSTEIDTGRFVDIDGSSHRLTGVILWRVVDVEGFTLRVENHQQTIDNTVRHHVISVAESMSSAAIYTEKDELNSRIMESLEPTLAEWGAKVTKIDLRTASSWE